MENGRAKLLRKGADAIVINDVTSEGVGFDSDLNAATFLTLHTATELAEMPKRQLADRILDEILALRRPRSLVLEFGEHQDEKARQDQVLQQTAASRRQIIVEQ
jgi:phosphopantothenoylcysteine decarboxylase/phosphopantothenate--cysteine ligase